MDSTILITNLTLSPLYLTLTLIPGVTRSIALPPQTSTPVDKDLARQAIDQLNGYKAAGLIDFDASALGFGGGTGPQGVTGFQGVTGPGVGEQGVTGSVGAQGVTGSSGVPGDTGFAGVTGAAGSQGSTGLAGTAGSVGAQGVTGLGVAGSQGATGLAGSDGSQGATGIAGLQGVTGGGLQGVTGSPGVTGPGGGEQGVTGLKGDLGATGFEGVQGSTGLSGSAGAQGVTGLSGLGEQGVTGLSGFGEQGVTGVDGLAGNTGLKGDTGLGAVGATGLQGVTGPSGGGDSRTLQTVSLSSGEVTLLVYATTAEAAGIGATKSGGDCTITFSSGSPQIMRGTVYFTSAQHGGSTVTITYPDASAGSGIQSTNFFVPVRYSLATVGMVTGFNSPSQTVSTPIALSGGNISFSMAVVSGTNHAIVFA